MAQGDNRLALDERGWLFLLKANPEKAEITDPLKISEADPWAHLARGGDQLFIRERHTLAAYRRSPSKFASASSSG